MAIVNYKTEFNMNQLQRLDIKGLIILIDLYLDMTKEEIFIKNNLATGLENLTMVKLINKEIKKRYEKK